MPDETKCPACAMTEEQVRELVLAQDLKNGLGSVLEFVAGAFRTAGQSGANQAACEKARAELLKEARAVISGKGHRAPNPGPVTPQGQETLG